MRRRTHTRGQAMLEFALVIPVFLLLLVGLFDFGRVIWVNNTLATAAREAARFAIVHGGADTAGHCPVGPTLIIPPDPSPGCPYPSPSKQAIKDVGQHWAAGTSNDVTVSVCYGAVTSCSGDVDQTGATNARGTQVMVTVTATVNLAAPSFFGFSAFDLEATSTMLVNH